ncbi:TPA: hypothetical protein QDC20_001410 [Burkholderia aenigmatica]|uniref:hypothetical protein n=1 Tax=Burkholderia sp. AU45251 TaxID=3059204 RepID=UPI00264F0EA5|nr:hypothetical protein [Burkholderia sp. AU45251]HDR9487155.1 hypothetical protein [Burkholderia aenigmatica]MDN7515755.1 hypothetical protein [Burkholderia sp. AU45251]HDR9518723.1 hypothetical protein [Burkholderia aenigmatica]HDR9520454.1 hypothetical protein [Burkholderia aenigmatica]HDR9595590.1 hypothetical protein [Burkholderia aenigmatica]
MLMVMRSVDKAMSGYRAGVAGDQTFWGAMGQAETAFDRSGFPADRFSPTVPEPRVDRPAGKT